MEVRRNEGVATHIGPKPCAGIREGVGEASAGECVDQPRSIPDHGLTMASTDAAKSS